MNEVLAYFIFSLIGSSGNSDTTLIDCNNVVYSRVFSFSKVFLFLYLVVKSLRCYQCPRTDNNGISSNTCQRDANLESAQQYKCPFESNACRRYEITGNFILLL